MLSQLEIEKYIQLEAERRVDNFLLSKIDHKGRFYGYYEIGLKVVQKEYTHARQMTSISSHFLYNFNDAYVIESELIKYKVIELTKDIFKYNVLVDEFEFEKIHNSLPAIFEDEKRNYFVENLIQDYENEIEFLKNKLIQNKIDSQLESEKSKIKEKLLEKERLRLLRNEVKQELIDQGLLFNNSSKRNTIPDETKNKVWNRDGGKCVYCQSNENLEFDHIIPFSKGGSNTYRNLQLLCEKCNREKYNNIG